MIYERTKTIITTLALALAASHPGTIIASPKGPNLLSERLLAQCKPATQHQQVIDWCHEQGLKVRSGYDRSTGLEIIELQTGQNAQEIERAANESGLFEFIEPDYPLRAYRIPNDSGLTAGLTWGLQNQGQRRGLADADIDAPEGWDYRTNAEDVVVAVIDSGIRYTHEDLRANLWNNSGEIPDNNRDDDRNGVVDDVVGFNAVNFSGDPWDDDGHGTAVSGVIGAVGNNRVGIAGVAWKVQIMSLKFLEFDGSGRTSDAIDCIDYALANGAHVINASWGGNGRSRSLERAIRRAWFRDVLFVTAAGNDRMNIDRAPDYPASYPLANIITVGSTTRRDRASSASNFGMDSVDLFAPGAEIYTTNGSGDRAYGFASGTSLAAPYVTGAVALMIASDPNLSSFELTSHLLGSVDALDSLAGLASSEGRLNLASALSRVSPEPELASTPLQIVRTSQGSRLFMRTEPGSAFLLEASPDLTAWRGIQRVQANDVGELSVEIGDSDDRVRFFRVRPLN